MSLLQLIKDVLLYFHCSVIVTGHNCISLAHFDLHLQKCFGMFLFFFNVLRISISFVYRKNNHMCLFTKCVRLQLYWLNEDHKGGNSTLMMKDVCCSK